MQGAAPRFKPGYHALVPLLQDFVAIRSLNFETGW